MCGIGELKYPVGEMAWVRYKNRKGEIVSIITSKESRDWYYLYDLVGDKFVKRGKAKSPPELVEKFNVYERMMA